MNASVCPGTFCWIKRCYRSKNGRYEFNFAFINAGSHIDIYCHSHPPLNGRDSDPDKTHIFESGKLCFVAGREPRTMARAQQLAAQWAEYFLEFRRTGVAQN